MPKKVIIQAGHSSALPPFHPSGGGAPGEAAWTTDLAVRLAARLSTRGVDVVLVGHWYDSARKLALPPPPEALQDADLFVSLHYDGSEDPNATGCCAGRAAGDPMGAAADECILLWTAYYPAALDIPLKQERVGVNITGYYAFHDTTAYTPGVLLEHGHGNCADHDTLFGAIDEVADADAAVLLSFLGIGAAAPPPPVAEPAPEPDPVAGFDFRLKMAYEGLLREPLYHKTQRGKSVRYVAVSEDEIQRMIAQEQAGG